MAECQLSDFQTEKIKRVFNILYDRDNNGVIERKDFGLAVEKIFTDLGWAKDDENYRDKYEKANKTMNIIWEGLKQYADKNKDDKVSEDEWVRMWGDCLKSDKQNKKFPEWQRSFIDFMFDVNDNSGDNEIDLDEYKTFWHRSYGIPIAECEKAFNIISGGKNISKETFESLWMEYFISNERSAKGNYLFGVPNFITE